MFELWQAVGIGIAGILLGVGSVVKVMSKGNNQASDRVLEDHLEAKIEKYTDEKLRHAEEKHDLRLKHIEDKQKTLTDGMQVIHDRVSEVKTSIMESKIEYLEMLNKLKQGDN